jgi:hypothetical protein
MSREERKAMIVPSQRPSLSRQNASAFSFRIPLPSEEYTLTPCPVFRDQLRRRWAGWSIW